VCVPVHAACGFWGTLATGLFGATVLGAHPLYGATTIHEWLGLITIQLIGASVIAVWAGVTGFILFGIINKFGLLRASKDAELYGLDIAEHKTRAYPEDMGDEFP
jgi:Amt family ammonium transporter